MIDHFFSMPVIAEKARRAAAEGCVLLKNNNDTLPLRKGDRVALFGRIAFSYYKSGLGSGGLVNVKYVVDIPQALGEEESITVDKQLLETYEAWLQENPYDHGQGWGKVPWSQKEMPVTDAMVTEAAARNDVAVVVIGRTAGEDQDIRNAEGSYLLTGTEKELIRKVCAAFSRAVVLLNVGSIIDMSWVEEVGVPSVMYVWQGGQEGGHGVVDVLTGRVNPSGRLTDTIAHSIDDYPAARNFGDPVKNLYQEDIYVGYRYFETFAPEKVLYPFGYGLSYTTFQVEAAATAGEQGFQIRAQVRNTGSCAGMNSVLVYVEAPQGKLGKPSRVLTGFAKTGLLTPGEMENLVINVPEYRYASYDDNGKTGHKSCYVLEAGTYRVYVGGDVRTAAYCFGFEQQEKILERLEEAYAPTKTFDRMIPAQGEHGYTIAYEKTPVRMVSPQSRREERMPQEIAFTGDRGIKLRDVREGRHTLEAFVAQLTDAELMHLFRGEGMCSPKVTPGTAAAFGGLTPALRAYGIPAGCCADGPSGIRMDCGTKAFSLPNGTLLGSTFNLSLIESLYVEEGLELRRNRVDTLLGPGMNIHRYPLNGRNFEYISEDPLVTGLCCAAQLRGMNQSGTTGTVKHFACNNQEFKRHQADGEVSERALREIYLKGYEYAVKEGGCRSVMTTYGPVNGLWTAGSYDLNTTVLRGEWGFDGIVMTDWWADANWDGGPGAKTTRAPMVAAQNDLYMVTKDCMDDNQDDLCEALKAGRINRAELQRGAKNILSFLMRSVAMEYEMGMITEEEMAANRPGEDDVDTGSMHYAAPDHMTGDITIDTAGWQMERGKAENCSLHLHDWGSYEMTMTIRSELNALAQLPVTIYLDNNMLTTVSIRGTEGKTVEEKVVVPMPFNSNHYLKFLFGADGIELTGIVLRKKA